MFIFIIPPINPFTFAFSHQSNHFSIDIKLLKVGLRKEKKGQGNRVIICEFYYIYCFIIKEITELNYRIQSQPKNNQMNILKSSFRAQVSTDNHKTNTNSQNKSPLNQGQNSSLNIPYKPFFPKYSYATSYSIKNLQNRSMASSMVFQSSFGQNQEGHLHRIMRCNLQKMSQVRRLHEKEKENLFKQISTLKAENKILKRKLQQQPIQNQLSKPHKQKQHPSSLQKRHSFKQVSLAILTPNPQKKNEGKNQIEEIKEKTVKLAKELQEYKRMNELLSVQKNNMAFTIEKLLKDNTQMTTQIQQLQLNQQATQQQLYQAQLSVQMLKRQSEIDKLRLVTEIERQKQQKQRQLKRQRERSYPKNQEITIKIMNEPRIVEKRVVKQLENQLKEKEGQVHERDHLISELNQKILYNGLAKLNTKYKYLMKV